MNRKELKNQIITLLEDVFTRKFHYDEEKNTFKSEYDYDCERPYIEANKEKISFSVIFRDEWRIDYLYIDKLFELTKCLKEFFK